MKYLNSRLIRFQTAFTLAALMVANYSLAAMRCDRKWVDVGATAYEVTSRCGDPIYQEIIREPVIGIHNSRLQATNVNDQTGVTLDLEEVAQEYREIERWTYDQGTGKLIREVDFYNGAVINIRTKDRGH